MKILFPDLRHIGCVARNLHKVCEEMRNNTPIVDQFITNLEQTFKKYPSRITLFHDICPGIKLPPSPSITRWGTWIDGATYTCDNFESLKIS